MTPENPTPLRRRPSLRDLAKRLGVSHTTVNLAIQGDPRVSAPLREKIREFAEREGYFPNDLAQGLRTGRTGLVGIVVPLLNGAFVSSLLEGAVAELWGANFYPIILCSGLDIRTEATLLERLARRRVEGVLLMPSREDSGKGHFAQLLKNHVPIVTVNNPVPRLELPLVASDDVLGGELATHHLIEAGHRKIFHIGSPLDTRYADRRRENGYNWAMKNAGFRPETIHYDARSGPDQKDAAFQNKLAEAILTQKATAAFCFNDAVALHVYAFCREKGVRIPDDLSVIGYSNEGWHGNTNTLDFTTPPLTSIDQNADQIGRVAATALMSWIQGKSASPEDTLLPPRLVKRSSVRRI